MADLKETQDTIEGVAADAVLAAKGVVDSSELKEQDRREAFENYKVITGYLVPALDNLEAFLEAQAVEPNTLRQYQQMIHRFTEKHPFASNVTAKNAREYIQPLSEDAG